MKTQIIQLSQKEDSISVRDKISWSQTERVLLVWPATGKVLNYKLDLVLVKRYTISRGAQLALVSHDPEVRFYAQEIKVPVFDSIREAQEQGWTLGEPDAVLKKPTGEPPDYRSVRASFQPKKMTWLDHPISRYSFFGLSMLAIIALVLLFLPGAKVVVNPREAIQSVNIEVTADQAATAVNLSTASVPTYFQDMTIAGSAMITATGTIPLPDEPAVTSLEFKNNSRQSITLPPGTVISTIGSTPTEFITISPEAVVIKPNIKMPVDARAVKPGSAGNLPADSLVVIEGDFASGLTVTNLEATQGGTDVLIPSPNQSDLDGLRELLRRQLEQAALSKLEAQLPPGDFLLRPSVKTLEILEETSSPSLGEPGDRLELSLRLQIQAQVVSSVTLQGLVTPIMDASIPAGYKPLSEAVLIQPAGLTTIEADGLHHWMVQASRMIQATIPPGSVADTVRGLKVTQAQQELSKQLQLEEQAQISLFPGWLPRLPYLSMRIKILQTSAQ